MLRYLNNEPSGKFENFCRMSASDFEYILNKIGPVITKLDTNLRKAIPAQERFAITLRFLASGDSCVSFSYLFKVSN
ncbi:protein ANTAGONIST OF LIKE HETEROCHROMATIN PROTEIN 1-like [Aphis craccivora]|uniref:Protein ANTAGONIST OF LIKE HETEROCHROMATIN PROTEIN 1-like n=1 Tax=Aphis craccivora TaxID=307492 RepID=A0A6G0VY99_APHCR|nr:protein ANTAGONIST OF LIKE HETEROCHROMATIN PROTEIN 1-like [Aphis craccivora]